MGLFGKKQTTPKFSCKECNAEFESDDSLNLHLKDHVPGVYCESCPLDMAIQKFTKLFNRKK